MAKIELEGFDEYITKIKALKADALKICKATVYPGAAILAEKMRGETEALPTVKDSEARALWRAGKMRPALSESQKAGLVKSLGISAIKRDSNGAVQTSVGFEGYNDVETNYFPKGQPNPEVARSLEKGTSYLRRDPFVSRAVKAARAEAVAAMSAECDRQIQRVMDSN